VNILALLTGGLFIECLICWICYRAGRADSFSETQEDMHDDEKKASLLRDRLRRDAGFASRVRERFTR
jgi:hypothetical protein